MNQTERLAYAWLRRQGYPATAIMFRPRRSPDFLTSDCLGWEVKLVRAHVVAVWTSQLVALREQPAGISFLLFAAGQRQPEVVPLADVPIPGRHGAIEFRVVDVNGASLVLRLDPTLQRLARVAAAMAGKSVNAWINDAIQGQLLREASQDTIGPLAAAMERRS